MDKGLRKILLTILFFSFGLPTFAQQEDQLSIGVLASMATKPYKNTAQVRLVPSLSYQSQNLSLSLFEGVSYKLVSRDSLDVSFAIKPRMEPYSEGESELFIGMKRSRTIDLSVKTRLSVARGTTIIINAASEYTNEHNGQEFDFALRQYLFGFSIPISTTVGVKRLSPNLSRFLYGVTNAESLSDRPIFSPGSVNIPYVSANSLFTLTDSLSLIGNARVNFYPNKIFKSPIVSERISISVLGGLSFTF